LENRTQLFLENRGNSPAVSFRGCAFNETLSRMKLQPLILINAVGLTRRLLSFAPCLSRLAAAGWIRSLDEVIPAVTCTAQVSMLTGKLPREHGIVGNGWLFRDTREIRFWHQSSALIESETIDQAVRRVAIERGFPFRVAKLFWWFNQGSAAEISVTPKPHYGADGNKVFGIAGSPDGICESLEQSLGKFPFHTFWGPKAGLPCTDWIARCTAQILIREHPELTLVYLPHLDYDPQRYGPAGCDMPRLVRELDDACGSILDAAAAAGARVWVVSEYSHADVTRPILLNRTLREAGLLTVRPGPFGEVLDTFRSRAFAVCDHQLAHIYVDQIDDLSAGRVRELIRAVPGVARVYAGSERSEIGLDHPRAGDLVALSHADSWFAYPYWLDDRLAPDFARTVDIHRKPGYDPCELFFDPARFWPEGRAIFQLARKKLGFRALFDVVPLEATLVRGSHGLPAAQLDAKPILIGDGPAPRGSDTIAMTETRDLLWRALVPD
jgi:predicted AlkP superfamily pyrophosphatase or phosphodiesterase